MLSLSLVYWSAYGSAHWPKLLAKMFPLIRLGLVCLLSVTFSFTTIWLLQLKTNKQKENGLWTSLVTRGPSLANRKSPWHMKTEHFPPVVKWKNCSGEKWRGTVTVCIRVSPEQCSDLGPVGAGGLKPPLCHHCMCGGCAWLWFWVLYWVCSSVLVCGESWPCSQSW